MIETYLVPEKTTVTAKGDGQAVDISGAGNRVFLLALKVSDMLEQESLEISVAGSEDGTTFGKPLAIFPQQFYCGETPVLLDLTDQPAITKLRAHWEVNRWGRGTDQMMVEFEVKLREVSVEVLAEARREAETRR